MPSRLGRQTTAQSVLSDGGEQRDVPQASSSPLVCRSDLVSARLLLDALKKANPDLLVLDESGQEQGSACVLKILDRIGTGAYGTVESCRLRLAEDNFDQLVAVKRFHSTHRPNLDQLNHFLREASVLGGLHHRNIVRLVGIGTIDGTLHNLYTAQELLEGPNMMTMIEEEIAQTRPRHRCRDSLRWCLQIAEVLRYIHIEHDLVHRDIKLSNVVLTSRDSHDADAKLLDWGLACKIPSEVSSSQDQPQSNLRGFNRTYAHPSDISLSKGEISKAAQRTVHSRSTSSPLLNPPGPMRRSSGPLQRMDVNPRSSTGSPVRSLANQQLILNTGSAGTAIYMAPEARVSSRFGPKVDIYSFGVLAYELFNYTTVLFEAAKEGYTANTGAIAMLQGTWAPEFKSSCPPEARQLILKCWSTNPADRPTADEIVTALTALQQKLYNRKPAPAPIRPVPQKAPNALLRSRSLGSQFSIKRLLSRLFQSRET